MQTASATPETDWHLCCAQERLLVQQLEAPGFWHVIARYGYAQRKEQGDCFVQARPAGLSQSPQTHPHYMFLALLSSSTPAQRVPLPNSLSA